MNVWVLGKVLELLSKNGGRFEINQLLFADARTVVTDSDEKLCRLVSELKVNIGMSDVIRSSRYGTGGRMHVILHGEPLEEVECF